jgi:biotin carboxylase
VNSIGYQLIAKPSLSFGGSRGVIRINDETELDAGIEHAMSETKDGSVILEEYLDGPEHTIESLVVDGSNHVLATSDKERTVNPYCVATSLNYPSQVKPALREQMNDIAQATADALGLENGATHIEVIQDGNELKLIDFGARGGGASFIPAKIVPAVSGVEMLKMMIRMALSDDVSGIPHKSRNGVVFRFFTPDPGIVTKIENVKEARQREDVLSFSLPLEVGDEVSPLETQLDRSGSFVVRGEDGDDAIQRAKEIEANVAIETEQR